MLILIAAWSTFFFFGPLFRIPMIRTPISLSLPLLGFDISGFTYKEAYSIGIPSPIENRAPRMYTYLGILIFIILRIFRSLSL